MKELAIALLVILDILFFTGNLPEIQIPELNPKIDLVEKEIQLFAEDLPVMPEPPKNPDLLEKAFNEAKGLWDKVRGFFDEKYKAPYLYKTDEKDRNLTEQQVREFIWAYMEKVYYMDPSGEKVDKVMKWIDDRAKIVNGFNIFCDQKWGPK